MFQLLLGVSTSFQARWDAQSLNRSLNLRQGLFSVRHAQKTSKQKCQGGFLIVWLKHFSWLLPDTKTIRWAPHGFLTAAPNCLPILCFILPSLMNQTQVTSKSLAWGNNSPPTWRETSTISRRWCPQQTWRLSGVMPHANQEDMFVSLKQHYIFFLP